MKYLFYLSLFLIPTLIAAQNPVNSGDLRDGFKIMRGNTKGTPFLTEKWHVGYGVFENGNTSRPQKMNYDIHGNNLVYQTGENSQVLKLLDNEFTGFILKGQNEDLIFTKVPGNQFDDAKKEAKYYKVVKAPSRKVLVEFQKDFDDPNASGWTSSTQNTKTAEYDLEINYYVLNPENKYEEVKLKERSVLKVFKNKKDELETFIESNNIDLETPEDLLKIVEYYYSII